jgi:hypothetical protein
MEATARMAQPSRTNVLAGRILSGFAVLFLIMDGVMKLMKPPQVVEATTVQLGFPEPAIVGIGVLLLACTVLYAVPRTAVLGAVLLTGYLGGAVAANVRVASPTFNMIFPILFAVLIWAGLILREERLRALLPLRR